MDPHGNLAIANLKALINVRENEKKRLKALIAVTESAERRVQALRDLKTLCETLRVETEILERLEAD
jgi:hypothetical protein